MTKKKFMNEFATTIEQRVPKDIDDYDDFESLNEGDLPF